MIFQIAKFVLPWFAVCGPHRDLDCKEQSPSLCHCRTWFHKPEEQTASSIDYHWAKPDQDQLLTSIESTESIDIYWLYFSVSASESEASEVKSTHLQMQTARWLGFFHGFQSSCSCTQTCPSCPSFKELWPSQTKDTYAKRQSVSCAAHVWRTNGSMLQDGSLA